MNRFHKHIVLIACAASLLLCAVPAAGGFFPSSDVPKGIWDYNTTTSTVTVPSMSITDVNVIINTLYHTFMADLNIWITSPQGTSVALSWYRGGGDNNMIGTIFDDSAASHISEGWPPFTGSFRPEQPLSAFNGQNAGGVWTLYVRDDAGLDSGSLQAWALEINGSDLAVPEPSTLLLAGVGILGAALWRKRRAA